MSLSKCRTKNLSNQKLLYVTVYTFETKGREFLSDNVRFLFVASNGDEKMKKGTHEFYLFEIFIDFLNKNNQKEETKDRRDE